MVSPSMRIKGNSVSSSIQMPWSRDLALRSSSPAFGSWLLPHATNAMAQHNSIMSLFIFISFLLFTYAVVAKSKFFDFFLFIDVTAVQQNRSSHSLFDNCP